MTFFTMIKDILAFLILQYKWEEQTIWKQLLFSVYAIDFSCDPFEKARGRREDFFLIRLQKELIVIILKTQ